MKDKKIILIFRLIERLKKGVCLKDFAREYNIDERTAQRYKKDIEEIFDLKLITLSRGCYIFPEIKKIDEIFLDKSFLEEFEKMASLLSLLNPKFLKYLNIDEKILKKIVNRDIFLIKESPYEDLENFQLLNKLKYSIKYRKVLNIAYFSDKEYYFYNVKPLKIVFAEGNWYLAGLSDDDINNGFKFLRINFIKDIKETSKTFQIPKEAVEFLKSFQTLFSKYKEPYFDVIVKVDKQVVRFFKNKKFLSSQVKIKSENGSLILKYTINNEIEILNLAKKWLPHMKIIKPYWLKEKFENMCKIILEE